MEQMIPREIRRTKNAARYDAEQAGDEVAGINYLVFD